MNDDNNNDKPKCRSCGARILWAETVKGRRIPLDAEPADGGNMVLEQRGHHRAPLATVLTGGAAPNDKPRYKSHFATCPNAQQHRRSK
jgi:hypothetical protein